MSGPGHVSVEDLGLLALGALPEQEVVAVKAHMADCVPCARKLAESYGHAALLAFVPTQEKPAGTIKAELMEQIRLKREAEESPVWAFGGREPAAIELERIPEKETEKGSWLGWVLVPVALLLALVSFLLSQENGRLKEELNKQRRAMEDFRGEQERARHLMGILTASDTTTVPLWATDGSGTTRGLVKYNARTGTLVYWAELPPLAGDRTYQMWLVCRSGAPLSAGLFVPVERESGQLSSAQVPPMTEVKAFSLTIEKAGGATRPTGPEVLRGAT